MTFSHLGIVQKLRDLPSALGLSKTLYGYSDTLLAKADTLFGQSLEQVNSRALNGNDIDCILGNGFAKEEFGHPIDGIPCQMQAGVDFFHDPFKDMVHSMLDDSHNGQEREVYFYHSDHLGSASWITDSGGQAIQHLQYLPYGEPYINQRTSGYNERFTFTGKERDEETGYGYFGARYMDHELMTMWLSVDPMSDKYPSISPYNYCVWNPIRLVDPDGRDTIRIELTTGEIDIGLSKNEHRVELMTRLYGILIVQIPLMFLVIQQIRKRVIILLIELNLEKKRKDKRYSIKFQAMLLPGIQGVLWNGIIMAWKTGLGIY